MAVRRSVGENKEQKKVNIRTEPIKSQRSKDKRSIRGHGGEWYSPGDCPFSQWHVVLSCCRNAAGVL